MFLYKNLFFQYLFFQSQSCFLESTVVIFRQSAGYGVCLIDAFEEKSISRCLKLGTYFMSSEILRQLFFLYQNNSKININFLRLL